MTTPFSMYQVGAEALLPPRDISVSQWADENVVLTGSGSAERGQWHTQTLPARADGLSSARRIRASRWC